MAAGFPTKDNFVAGDVLTATNMNDLGGTVNLVSPTAKGSLKAGTAAATFGDLAIGANATVLTADSTAATGMKWAATSSPADVWTLISTTTLATGSPTSVTISGLTYDKIVIKVDQARTNAVADEYRITPTCGTTTGSQSVRFGRLTNEFMLAGVQNTAFTTLGGSGANGSAEIYMFVSYTGCKSTDTPKIVHAVGGSDSTAPYTNAWVADGVINATAALTAITLGTSGGGAFTGGVMKVYGA